MSRYLITILIFLVSCAKRESTPLEFNQNINSQKIFNSSSMSTQMKFLKEEFSYTCIECHAGSEYKTDYGLNNIYERNFILKSLYRAKYPEDNWIIKKISPKGVHGTTPLCNDHINIDCEALIIAWLQIYKSEQVFSVSDINNFKVNSKNTKSLQLTLKETERLYLFSDYPNKVLTLKKIIKGPISNFKIKTNNLWGAALVSITETKLISF